MFVFLQKILPKHLLSRLVGWVAESENSFISRAFINTICFFYDINLEEAERTSKRDYVSFNDFFTRSLKEGARKIEGELSSPADGKVANLGDISGDTVIQSKNHQYSLTSLLGESGSEFANGSFITIYLAPHNYHRVHMPCAARLKSSRYIPGELFSVNQTTANELPGLFARNERLVCQFETETGNMALIMVGAMLVAGIKPVWQPEPYMPKLQHHGNHNLAFQQGDELGQFQMGSTAILITDFRARFAVSESETVWYGQSLTA